MNDNNSERKHPGNNSNYGANTLVLTQNTIGNGKKWANKDISVWIENVLIEQFETGNEKINSDMKEFMTIFDSLMINSATIRKLNACK